MAPRTCVLTLALIVLVFGSASAAAAGCVRTPGELLFGDIPVGTFLDKSFAVTNTGTEPITIYVDTPCVDYYDDCMVSSPDFTLIAGGGGHTLGPGETTTATIRFEPSGEGTKRAAICLDGDCLFDITCGYLYLTGGTDVPTGETPPVIALHATTHVAKVTCPDAPDFSCDQYRVDWPLGQSVDLWLVGVWGDAPGIAEISCGILYENGAIGADAMANGVGVDLYSWFSCADLEFPNSRTGLPGDTWPASGGGNRILWDFTGNCQLTSYEGWGFHAVAGCFYVYAYSDDVFRVTTNYGAGGGSELILGDCTGSRVSAVDTASVGFGSIAGYNPCDTTAAVTGVEPPVKAPGAGPILRPASPNPFLSATHIAFRSAADGPVSIRVFDIAGREVARPYAGTLPAGEHDVVWDGRSFTGARMSAGIYLYRVETAEGSASGKVVLVN